MKRLASMLLLSLTAVPALGAQTSAAPREITVYAAASLTDAFGELGKLMEQDSLPTRVRYNFAGSQQLAVQLEQGAKADVFASADQRWMDYVRERHLTAGRIEDLRPQPAGRDPAEVESRTRPRAAGPRPRGA